VSVASSVKGADTIFLMVSQFAAWPTEYPPETDLFGRWQRAAGTGKADDLNARNRCGGEVRLIPIDLWTASAAAHDHGRQMIMTGRYGGDRARSADYLMCVSAGASACRTFTQPACDVELASAS
jgi:hypothetical protein